VKEKKAEIAEAETSLSNLDTLVTSKVSQSVEKPGLGKLSEEKGKKLKQC